MRVINDATSGGVVRRWVGFFFFASANSISLSGIMREAGVSVTPARIALAVMPRGASSTASCRI